MSNKANGFRLAAALLASVAGASLCVPAAHAETPAVEALLKQADYWRSKGRNDLAEDALRRARKLAPNSEAVRKASSPVPAPAAKPAPAPAAAPAATERLTRSRPVTTAATKPAPAPKADTAGRARVAGFDALDSGDLANAAAQFQKALNANRRDADALGGLGLVRLNQSRFAEAADLLQQASRYGKPAQWAEGLAAAQFFAGIDDARELLTQGRLADAQAKAEELVRSGYAKPAPALELLADIYERQERFADAADLYRQASSGGAQDEKRLMLRAARSRALAAAQRGDTLGAESEFQNGMLIDQDDPWIRYEFARFMIKRGRVAETESLIRSLATSGKPDSIYAAALLNRDLGRASAAGQLLDQIPLAQQTQQMRNLAIELKTDSAIARAKAIAANGSQAEAMTALRQLGNTPGMPMSKLAAIASAMLDIGATADAESVASRALDGQVRSVEDYEGLISVLSRTGRDDLARLALQRAGQLAGSSQDGQEAFGRMNATLATSRADRARLAGNFAEAFDILQAAWNASPQNVDVLRALSRLYQSGNMPARAAQTFQLVLVRDPRDKEALLGLASAAQAAGDRVMSEKAQQDVLRSYPEDYEVRMTLAQVEQARGNERAAVKLLKEARELYARQQGIGSIPTGGNPFAASGPMASTNPFRDTAPAPAPNINPFALGNGTRLGGAMPTPASYAPAPSYAAGNSYAASGAYAPATGYNGSMSGAAASAQPVAAWQAPASAGYGAQSGAYSAAPVGDPVMMQLQSEIAELSQDSGPQVEFNTSYRKRSGETGLSSLDEIKGTTKFSTDLAGGRAYVRAEATVLDAGRPSGSGLARFGRNATLEAQAIVDEVPSPLVQADTQHKSGVALAVGYESDLLKLEAGTTPMGIGETELTFHGEVSPRLSENALVRGWVERQAVTDSVISYAGTRDPVTGETWGQVMRTGGGVAFSWDQQGSGFYGDLRYNRFAGTNVRDNNGIEANIGGYLRAWQDQHSSLTAGINFNYQSYDNNQNYFTFGHGGYFSPQSFLSVGFPINYRMKTNVLELAASLTPGFQSYSQDEVVLYPTDPTAQAQLDALKSENTDVRSYYDSLSKTGFAVSADASAYYRVSRNTRIGGQTSYNSFGNYNEFRSMVGVRQSFGSGE